MSGVVAWDGSSGKSCGAEGGLKEYGGCGGGGGGVSEGSEGVIAGWVIGASVRGLRNKEVLYEIGDDAFVLVYSSERDQSLDAVKVTSVRMW
jgi:hypothetical protein